jgi:hypothetical protein
MSYPISPMTKLDAINICLSSMGEPTVNTLDGAAVDAQMASDLIEETSRSVQSMGWHWNREKHTISPNAYSELTLPANTLRVDSIDESKEIDVVQRGLRLFDVENASYSFTIPVVVELYVHLLFEDLPFAAKQFITMRAARLLQQRLLGSETLYKFHGQDEQRAWVILMQEETEVADGNMLYDSASTSKVVTRGYFSRGGFG